MDILKLVSKNFFFISFVRWTVVELAVFSNVEYYSSTDIIGEDIDLLVCVLAYTMNINKKVVKENVITGKFSSKSFDKYHGYR